MRHCLVTLETDGLRDYVVFPSGERKILGAISVLKFVLAVAPRRGVRDALDAFNNTGKAMVLANLDAMDVLFRPVISRFASENPLIGYSDRTPVSSDGATMDPKAIMEHLGKIEGVVTSLKKFASTGERFIAPRYHEGLRSLVGALHFTNPGDQSKNDAWYVNGPPKVDTVDPGQKIPESITHAPSPSTTPVYAPGAKTASEPSFRNLKSNTQLAESVLAQVEETNQKVDALVTAGRRFNASRAKADLYKVASEVTEILDNVDLAQPWVQNDLQNLASRSAHIHGLFASAKV